MRVVEWAEAVVEHNPQGHYQQDFHLESSEIHSWSLWRLPGLRYEVYGGIQEGFMIEKTNLETQEKHRQYFISNRPSNEWSASSVLDRILLHWDTETGVFGIKDNTFQEDKVRYKSIERATAHVSLLNVTWNSLYAPVFDGFWQGEPLSCRIQFFKDYPEYNPLS